jgi:hypothetical protein
VPPKAKQEIDWTDAESYAPLLEAERSIFAWEWLRRDSSYRAAASHPVARKFCGEGPERWGLHAFENPDLAAPHARPMWRRRDHPFVLQVVAWPTAEADNAFELERFAGFITLIGAADGREHLLLSDGLRSIRIDVLAGSLGLGPVRLHYRLAGVAAAERPLLTLRRVIAMQLSGRFSPSLHAAEAKAGRWILMLRAHDALAAGADQREIAVTLLSRSASQPRWRSEAPSLRSQAQRLVRGARRMAVGGYRELLR